MRTVLGCFMILLLCTVAMAAPKEQLPAPENVTCSLVGEGVEVSWDMIPEATGYQVQAVCRDPESEEEDQDSTPSLNRPVVEPPISMTLADLTQSLGPCQMLGVRVRGAQAKKADQPPQAGRKGVWSEYCTLTLP